MDLSGLEDFTGCAGFQFGKEKWPAERLDGDADSLGGDGDGELRVVWTSLSWSGNGPRQGPPKPLPAFSFPLKSLLLQVNQLDVAMLSALARAESLEHLSLADIRCGDEVPAALSRLTRLRQIALPSAAITNAGLADFAKLPDLKSLTLTSATDITEEGLRAVEWNSPDVKILLPGGRLWSPSSGWME